MIEQPKKTIATETKSRILDQAARLFRENGYAAISLRAIAEAAGMKAGSVYYHFKSKEEIVLEVLDTGIRRVHSAVDRAWIELPTNSAADTLISTCVTAHLDTLLTHSDYTSANVRIYGQVPENIRLQALSARRDYEQLWDKILQQANQSGKFRQNFDLKLFRLLLIGSLNATLEWFDPDQGDITKLSEEYSKILLRGIMET